ncbi:ap2 domain transcription factor ap2x-6 [Cystoisospora suis]|uniref:Ap2 domain transcription factor ap2x-6 n=1 Tax=Cystoisospora suis TaxID=483139 RepID=A0A2C6L8D0_9APIC|nr:ap2 domain transcription factor ap2x-6 [Cystoisospora suis]
MGGTITEARSHVPVRYLLFCGLILAVLLVDGAPDVKEGAKQQAKPPAVVGDDGSRDAIAREDTSASGEVNVETEVKHHEAAVESLLGAEKTEEKRSPEREDLESEGEAADGTEPSASSEQRPPASTEQQLPEDEAPVEPQAPYVEAISAECLRYHNLFRVDQLLEPLPHLQNHPGMDEYVTALLRRSVEAGCRHFDMPSNTPFGANFYATSAEKPTCMGATHLWYRGIDNFHGRYPGSGWQNAGANQFIQMMWAHTEYLACARTRACSQSMNQLLCLYYPGGNVTNEKPFSEPMWKELLERHQRWKRYDEPGGRRDRRPRTHQS